MSNEFALESLWSAIDGALPRFSAEEARAAVEVYQELASGQPLDTGRIAERLNIAAAEATKLLARDTLRRFAYRDESGRVVGFGGLAVLPMHHVFALDGRTLYTWCAWDALFLPRILERPAEVTSPCPETGREIRVRIGPDGIERVEPETAVLSFLSPQAATFDRSAANVMARFCHHVFFLADHDAGAAWVARHPGTFLCSLEDGYVLGRRLVARNFGPVLERRAAAAGGASAMRSMFAALGAVSAAFAASLCCSGPLLFVAFGIGGAGLASMIEPLRPWLLGLTTILLGLGFYSVYGPGPRCAPDEDAARRLRRRKRILWTGTILALGFATFPTWSTWIL